MRTALILIGMVFAVHLVVGYTDLYPRYLWVDNIMHLFGGGVLGYLFFSSFLLLNHRGLITFQHRGVFFIAIVAMSVLAGVVWEFFEYLDRYVGVFVQHPEFMTYDDTIADLFWDVIGSGAIALFFLFTWPFKRFYERRDEIS